jgi:hypothetical protein
MVDWVRDDLADLLWPAALIASEGDSGLRRFGRMQEAVVSTLKDTGRDLDQLTLDGRLTSLEAVPHSSRAELLPSLRGVIDERHMLPPQLLAVLRIYDVLPGAWLLVEPWADVEPEVPDAEALGFLSAIMSDVIRDDHRHALLMFAPMLWSVFRQQITMSAEMIEVLQTYPTDLANHGRADSMIRASFGGTKAVAYLDDPALKTRREAWAASFWRQNWRLSPCFPEEEREEEGHEEPEADLDPAGDYSEASDAARSAVAATVEHFNRFLEGSLDQCALDLYDPAKHEVVSGLVSRAGRAVIAVLRAPHMWSGEHAAGVIRMLAETEIILCWLATRSADSYRQYQSYGRGKAKLMRRHMSNLAASFPETPPADLTAALNHLQKKLGGEWGEEFVEVSLDSTFAGVTLHQMAKETGLSDIYRYEYQTMSGVAHGEWWAIEDYAMQRCLNPLHRFHQIPSMALSFGSDATVAHYLSAKFGELVTLALTHLDVVTPTTREVTDPEA